VLIKFPANSKNPGFESAGMRISSVLVEQTFDFGYEMGLIVLACEQALVFVRTCYLNCFQLSDSQ
jgi:hypothetical protein